MWVMGIKKVLFGIAYLALAATCVPIYYRTLDRMGNSTQNPDTYQNVAPAAKKNTVSITSHEFADQTITNLSDHSSAQGLENIFAFE